MGQKQKSAQQILADMQRELARVEDRRATLKAGIAAILEVYGPSAKAKPAARVNGQPPHSSRANQVLPIAEAAAVVIREAGRAMRVNEILEAIMAKGLVREIKRTSLVSALDRRAKDNEGFSKPKAGTYDVVGRNGK